MAPNNQIFENFESQAIISNPKECSSEVTTLNTILENNVDLSSILENPMEAIDINFLLAFNDDEEIEENQDVIDEAKEIFDFGELDLDVQNFDFQVESQSCINDFNTDLLPKEDKILTKSIVIEGLDEFLQQVPSKIAFEVPVTPEQDVIPVTVVDHQSNFTQYEHDEMSWQSPSPYYLQSFSPLPRYTQQVYSPSSGYSSASASPTYQQFSSQFSVSSQTSILPQVPTNTLKKRGRKPKPWLDDSFNNQYVQEAKDLKEAQQRRNNVSSGQYRKRKQEQIEEMEREIVKQEAKKIKLERKTAKLDEKIAKLQALVNWTMSQPINIKI